jgi:predicted nuclease of predicted toxin-antitoxin system
MKFIVDAQLPRRLARELAASGHDAVHTLDFPAGNRTPDGDITTMAVREGRVVVTKDNDFVTSFLLKGMPPKLLLISTGNISNDALSKLVAANLKALEAACVENNFVELSVSAITIHA